MSEYEQPFQMSADIEKEREVEREERARKLAESVFNQPVFGQYREAEDHIIRGYN